MDYDMKKIILNFTEIVLDRNVNKAFEIDMKNVFKFIMMNEYQLNQYDKKIINVFYNYYNFHKRRIGEEEFRWNDKFFN